MLAGCSTSTCSGGGLRKKKGVVKGKFKSVKGKKNAAQRSAKRSTKRSAKKPKSMSTARVNLEFKRLMDSLRLNRFK